VRPAQFVVSEDAHGRPKLDVVEAALEQTYRVGDHHSVALFLALARKNGLLPYRRARQHEGTVCVRATLQLARTANVAQRDWHERNQRLRRGRWLLQAIDPVPQARV
jgi:hypothetical protein